MADIPGITTVINPGSQIVSTHNCIPQLVTTIQQDATPLMTVIQGNWDVVWSVNGQTGDVLIDVVLGDFQPNTTYTKNAAIVHDGYEYVANKTFTSGESFDVNDWSMVSWQAPAADISYDKQSTGLASENVQDAITELKQGLDTKEAHADLAKVAETGSLHDLVDASEFSAMAFSTSFNDLTDVPDFKPVATSGDYNDLVNIPDIPFGAYLLATKEWTYAQWKQYGTADVSTNFNFTQIYYPISKIKAGDICYINGKVTDKSDCPAMIIARATSKTADSVTVTAISFWVENTEIIPTKTSDITNDSDFRDGDQVDEAVDTLESSINSTIDKTVMTNITISSTGSTDTIKLDNSKQNILSGATSSDELPLPVANANQAGVMNAATFQAIQSNADNIGAILNGSVAIVGMSDSPTDEQLSEAWKTETKLTTLINGAKIADITNKKVWTYYTNTDKWYAATNTTQVVVNQWTNLAAGIIKGSTIDGQIFADPDGTGSVNGWDALVAQANTATADVATLKDGKVDKVTGKELSTNDFTDDLKNKLNGIETGAEVNVQSDWSTEDTESDTFIKNKPTIGNGILTIKQNGQNLQTFSANSTDAAEVDISCVTSDAVIHTESVEPVVSTNLIVDKAITTDKLADASVTGDKVDWMTMMDAATFTCATDVTVTAVATSYYIPYDGTYFNKGIGTLNSDGSITISKTGWYYVRATVYQYTGWVVDVSSPNLYIKRDDTRIVGAGFAAPTKANPYVSLEISGLVSLTAGSKLSIEFMDNGGTAPTAGLLKGYSNIERIDIVKIREHS